MCCIGMERFWYIGIAEDTMLFDKSEKNPAAWAMTCGGSVSITEDGDGMLPLPWAVVARGSAIIPLLVCPITLCNFESSLCVNTGW